MERINELLGRLSELSADELAELRSLIVEEADRLDSEDITVESVAALQELLEKGEQVMARQQELAAEQAAAEQAHEEAKARIAALKGEEPAEEPAEEPEGEPESTEEPQGDGEPEGEPEQTEPVAASGAVRRMAARQAKPTPSPEATPTRPRASLTASGNLRGGRGLGEPIETRDELGQLMAETLNRMSRNGPARGDVLLASAHWEYPEDRRLGDDQDENARKLDAVTGPQALVASGGICLPVDVDFAIPTWSGADRPLRDGLPSFQATRGGLRYVQPPSMSGLAGATSIWTEATDASPGGSTKPVLTVSCGAEQLVYVDAIPTRLAFGNMQARFAPEQVAANTDLAIAAGARIAENNILAKIAAMAVANIQYGPVVGATRDILSALHLALGGYRSLHRIPDSHAITAIFPEWLRDMIKADLARETAHQQDSSWNSLSISDEQVNALFTNVGVRPLWHLDGQPVNGSIYPAQVFGAQGATGALNAWPAKVVWYMFAEGMVQFLDGGRLDLGVVRDSTLDATNDYETFVETFEAVANRGFANGIYQMVTTLCANGSSAGTVNTASNCS